MDRQKEAVRLHALGYSCAQSVLCAVATEFDLDFNLSYKITEGLSGGVAHSGNICGVCTAMALAVGYDHSAGVGHPGETKMATCNEIQKLLQAFQEKHGSCLCKELGTKGPACDPLLETGVALLEQYRKDHPKS